LEKEKKPKLVKWSIEILRACRGWRECRGCGSKSQKYRRRNKDPNSSKMGKASIVHKKKSRTVGGLVGWGGRLGGS